MTLPTPSLSPTPGRFRSSNGITAPYNITLFGFGQGSSGGDTSPLMSTAGTNTWTGNITFNDASSPGNIYFVVGL